MTKTFTISETVQPSSTSGQSILTVAVMGQNTNFTINHLVDSSQILFPIIPISNSQTFNYDFHGVALSFTVTKTGTSTGTLNGGIVQLTNYAFTGTVNLPSTYTYQYGNIQMGQSVQGHLQLLPSNLLYSLDTTLPQNISLKIQLVSTSIAYDAPATAQTSMLTTQLMLYGSIAAGVVAIGVGAFYLVRRLSHKSVASPTSPPVDKPAYWVD
jgi:hypothetical protein